jgi:type IV pilus assembly protein PilB
MQRKKLGDLLVEQGLLTYQQLSKALDRQRSTGKALGEVLIDLGFMTEGQLTGALAEQQDVETWDLKRDPPSPEAISTLNPEFCISNLVVPVKVEDGSLVLAMRSTGNLPVIDAVHRLTHLRVLPVQVSDALLASCLHELYGDDPSLADAVESFVSRALDEVSDNVGIETGGAISEEETRPVIGLVNQIIMDAIEMGASDIHLEPRGKCADLRYRVDGRLMKVREIPASLLPMVGARFKIMADLDIAEHRLPQDGRIQVRAKARNVDLRLSILPTHYGPRVVGRVLDRSAALKSMEQIGFSEDNAGLFQQLIEKPYGIVLVTGPTGSGKTTTLYAAINAIKNEGTNIMTCEDPIEYDIHGINQSQVNEKTGLTFATQLRAILRQDPDVILVGEIRDQETVKTAIRASLTGHLVLSTLHCNDAASAIPRLLDMGAPAYMLSTSLIGVVAQRLLRMLCQHCKEQATPTVLETQFLNSMGYEAPKKIWHARGCQKCYNTGFSGRAAVHEILPITEEVAHLIASSASMDELRAAGAECGMRSIQHDAVARVFAGETTIEEAKRMIFFDTFGHKRATGKILPLAS